MTLTTGMALGCVLFFFVLAWYGLSYMLSPQMKNADGLAKVTGSCGDTMEIGLKLNDGKVVRTHFWTDGCSMSRTCVESAARLAYGKTPEMLESIKMIDIVDDIGHIPDTHLHCAQLAEITLHQAVEHYRLQHQEQTVN